MWKAKSTFIILFGKNNYIVNREYAYKFLERRKLLDFKFVIKISKP